MWLSTDQALFLNGRFVSANWPIDELMEWKGEILKSGDLKMVVQGKFGIDG